MTGATDELPFDPRRHFAAAEGITDEQAALVERYLEAEDLFEHEEVAELADNVAVRWEADAFHAGARHTDRYVRWLTAPDPQLAGYAAELLVWFAPDEAALAAGLTAVPGNETRAATRASANLTLAHCPVGSEPTPASASCCPRTQRSSGSRRQWDWRTGSATSYPTWPSTSSPTPAARTSTPKYPAGTGRCAGSWPSRCTGSVSADLPPRHTV
ncbi:hypothetical protein [Micromonospora cremea]|uniref:Uncharacterized protein n=1 Tax=Micromonospora cremea TaxID=709881 RepID=A0A1N5U9G3_9ACTN|nr:hypothetical protein [Micromonospora cremea]SIM57571.1 hypothetical protein SAMN04489832_0733 [Micromonospora cremea]